MMPHISLLQLFTAIYKSRVGSAIRESYWLFPAIEALHLLGLAVIGGAVLIVDLRLFGFGLRHQPVADIARDAQPWLIGSLIFMFATGGLLFISEATKCYYHEAFWFKMTSLLLAIVFTFTAHRKVAFADDHQIRPIWCKTAAIVSILLWSGVGIGGRWIGFS